MGALVIRHGSWSDYVNASSYNNDTLYFITDAGVIMKGQEIVTNKVTCHESENVCTITYYDGSEGASSNGSTITVYNKSAIDAIKTTLNSHISTIGHGASSGDTGIGHVALSDSTQSPGLDVTQGTAATPKAVNDALASAITYIDELMSEQTGGMVFKGTIGSLDDDAMYTELPSSGYSAGWTYYIVTDGTYAGQSGYIGDTIIAVENGPASGSTIIDEDWTVLRGNSGNNVISNNTLTQNRLIIGDGNRKVKELSVGQQGQFLIKGESKPEWRTVNNAYFGIGIKTVNATSTNSYPEYYNNESGSHSIIEAAIQWNDFKFVDGAIISILFKTNISFSNLYLRIYRNPSEAGDHYYSVKVLYRDSDIQPDTILRNDTVTLMLSLDGGVARWHVISIERPVLNEIDDSYNPVSSSALREEFSTKQDKLTAGDGIFLRDDTISLIYDGVNNSNTNNTVTGQQVYQAIQNNVLSWRTISQ